MRGQWLQIKSTLYRESKRLANLLNITPPQWRTSTSRELRQFLRVNQSQERFIQRQTTRQDREREERLRRRQRRARERREAQMNYLFDQRRGFRTYFINNMNIETSQINEIMRQITNRLNHSLRTGITQNSDVNISFTLFNDGYHSYKAFNSFLIRDLADFQRMLNSYVSQTSSRFTNYTYNIQRIKIQIVRENSGGCNNSNHDKINKHGNVKLINPKKTKNNNCLFACLADSIDIGNHTGRGLAARRNEIRSEFNLDPNSVIPISIALKIFEKYKKENKRLSIVDEETKQEFGEKGDIIITLSNSHYVKVEDYPLNKCEHCLTEYRTKHTCNTQKVSYVNAKLKKTSRVLLHREINTKPINNDSLIHYDIETIPLKLNENSDIKLQTPYILGYNEGDKFKYFSGVDCIASFVDYLLSKADKKSPKIYVNAFNGSNFDHYTIYNEFIKRNLKPDKLTINNGSIIQFQYKNICLFDICKHLTGPLKDNLKSFDCKILKGDFDHDDKRLLGGWENMPLELKLNCLKYLRADVMGLKELYEKLNNGVYEKHKVNITDYISTSSLTFNLWKEDYMNNQELLKETEYKPIDFINLPTLEQEKAFRKSVRGGRTYKSKHRFKSKQYEAFINGEVDFDNIEDYLIDADVVSLYPTAMAKYPYPVGLCKKLETDKEKVIFSAKYKGEDIEFKTKKEYVEYLKDDTPFNDTMLKKETERMNKYITNCKRKGKDFLFYGRRRTCGCNKLGCSCGKSETYECYIDYNDHFEKEKRRLKVNIEWHLEKLEEHKVLQQEKKEKLRSFNPDEFIDEHEIEVDREMKMKGKLGIYYIKYKTNKNLQHSIGGRRADDGSLKWDLKDGEGWYTSIDIEDMTANGYQIEISDGYYWEKTAYIFKEFIEDLFIQKQNSEKGTVQYSLAKLFMNALYGKMIQRPINDKTQIISNNAEYWKFWGKHIIKNVEKVGETWAITGTPKEVLLQEKCITKPTQLGAFILAYSRRIMLNYIQEANPHFNSNEVSKRIENDFYYTDTDSLQMHCKNAKMIKTLGNKELGGITDDLGDDCKIIRGIWIAPKLYMLEYIKKGDKKLHYHFRGKGLKTDNLTVKNFEDMDAGKSLTNIREFQFKKINIKRNSKQRDIPQFSIVHYSKSNETDISRLTKTVNAKLWDGRNFTDNDSIPWV